MTPPLERARVVAAEAAGPNADRVDADARFPFEAMAAIRQAGLLGVYVPAELGGGGLRLSDVAAICHALGRGCGSTGLIYAMHQIQVACIARHCGESEWHRTLLRQVASEQLLLASATTEGATGGDLGRSECAVERSGERFTLEKRGAVISYGDDADVVLITARRAPDAPGSDQVLVVAPRRCFELAPTGGWDTLGMRGTCSNTYLLRAQGHVDQVVPCPYGDIQSDTMVPVSHLTWASVWLGIATDALARARRHLRGKNAADTGYSPAHARLVRATGLLQQLRADVAGGLRLFESALAGPERANSFALLATMNNIKMSVSTGIVDVVREALLIAGISGYRNDSPVSVGRHLRDAHSAALMVANDRIALGMGKMLLMQRNDPDLLA